LLSNEPWRFGVAVPEGWCNRVGTPMRTAGRHVLAEDAGPWQDSTD
jgi:hypothetical protein